VSRDEPLESSIARAIVRYLRSLPEAHARRVHGGAYGSAGEPDVDAVVSGRAVKVEVKRPSQRSRVTPLQRAALRRWEKAGAVAIVACSVDEVRDVLRGEGLVPDATTSRT